MLTADAFYEIVRPFKRGLCMRKRDVDRFKKVLLERKQEIISSAETMREEGIGFDEADLADEVDLASTEADQAMNLRLHDRELVLLRKIDRTLKKIEDGEFGVCEHCGEEINIKRLEARPVAEVCIRCKEDMEKQEKGYAE
jgi:DnaK suppressor protein